MAVGTQPLTLGEILDRTVQLYRRNFLLLVGIAAPPAAVMALVTGAVVICLFLSPDRLVRPRRRAAGRTALRARRR